MLLGSTGAKAAHRMLMKLTPGFLNCDHFNAKIVTFRLQILLQLVLQGLGIHNRLTYL